MSRENQRTDDTATDDRGIGSGTGDDVAAGTLREKIRKDGATFSRNGIDQDLLMEAVRRGPLLDALRAAPATATELDDSLELSRSTIHRAGESLQERGLIEKSNGQLELTGLGTVVADEVTMFEVRMRTAASLEPFLNTIDSDGVPVEHFTDATVTRPKPRQPHVSIQRIIELIEDASSLRMLSTVLSSIYVDVGYREMMDGMEIEAVFDEQAISIMLSEFQEKARETIETGNFDVYVHSGLPFELFVFDDKVGLAAHDENGIAQVFIESDSTRAIAWAEEFYAQHLGEAEPLWLSDR